MKIKVCSKSSCQKHGEKDVYKELKSFSKDFNKYLKDHDIDKKGIKIKECGCQGNCKHGPSVQVKHKDFAPADAEKVEAYILKKYKLQDIKL
jgi:NADH:ubiquinone oxidoreductase subunit E